jgi:hypothetical protein
VTIPFMNNPRKTRAVYRQIVRRLNHGEVVLARSEPEAGHVHFLADGTFCSSGSIPQVCRPRAPLPPVT